MYTIFFLMLIKTHLPAGFFSPDEMGKHSIPKPALLKKNIAVCPGIIPAHEMDLGHSLTALLHLFVRMYHCLLSPFRPL